MRMRIGFCLLAVLVLAAGCMEGRLTDEQLAANAADAKGTDGSAGDIADGEDGVPEVQADEVSAEDADADAATADGLEGLDAEDCEPADCNDDNPCTTDACVPVQGCTHAPIAGTCNDGDSCTVADACSAGECKGTAKSCGDNEVCSGGACVALPPEGMALIPAGSFQMGCVPDDIDCLPTELPRHPVMLDAYFIDDSEVTVGEFAACVKAGACDVPKTGVDSTGIYNWAVPGAESHPVNGVSWNQADAYCRWTHPLGQLPTEAQWEKAARGGLDGKLYPWGNDLPTCSPGLPNSAVYGEGGKGCGKGGTWPVGTGSSENGYGLYDMAGNVIEWTADWLGSDYYASSPGLNPTGPADGTGKGRVLRGSSFIWSNTTFLRASRRGDNAPSAVAAYLGFRCARRVPCQNDVQCDDGKACTKELCQAGVCTASPAACGANATCVEPTGQCSCDPTFVGDGQTCLCGPQTVAIDVDGKTVCAPDYPAWGIRPESPPTEWFKDTGDGTISDTQSKLVWEKGHGPAAVSHSDAAAYCQGLVLADKSDWRLPSRAELLTLLDFGLVASPILSAFQGTPPDMFWSASRLADPNDLNKAWTVSFEHAITNPYDLNALRQVRCVRAPDVEPPTARYKVNIAKGVVMDSLTQLTWQRDGKGSGSMSWSAAKAACGALSLDGGGWRLPTIVELESIVDAQAFSPAVDSGAFPDTPNEITWSSTKRLSNGEARIVYFENGGNNTVETSSPRRFRCVRGGACVTDAECHDGNACTEDACKAGVCANTEANDGQKCDENMTCKAGACVLAVPDGMAFIPSGKFSMGCIDGDGTCSQHEKPKHEVSLDAYFMDITEVTVAAYQKCIDDGQCAVPGYGNSYANYGKPERLNHPVNGVSWAHADKYCKWAGRRLPTEAEWERAARGGVEGKKYPWGDTAPTCSAGQPGSTVMSNGTYGCGKGSTWPVGSLSTPNGFGLQDMVGNVWEWVADWYSAGYYSSSYGSNPKGPSGGLGHVLRGGCLSQIGGSLRTSLRMEEMSEYDFYTGFRCAKSLP